MKEETIEDKVRKIQSLFLDQIEVRLFTDTEIDQEGKKYYAFGCESLSISTNNSSGVFPDSRRPTVFPELNPAFTLF